MERNVRRSARFSICALTHASVCPQLSGTFRKMSSTIVDRLDTGYMGNEFYDDNMQACKNNWTNGWNASGGCCNRMPSVCRCFMVSHREFVSGRVAGYFKTTNKQAPLQNIMYLPKGKDHKTNKVIFRNKIILARKILLIQSCGKFLVFCS